MSATIEVYMKWYHRLEVAITLTGAVPLGEPGGKSG